MTIQIDKRISEAKSKEAALRELAKNKDIFYTLSQSYQQVILRSEDTGKLVRRTLVMPMYAGVSHKTKKRMTNYPKVFMRPATVSKIFHLGS
jgi:hypothetical protein